MVIPFRLLFVYTWPSLSKHKLNGWSLSSEQPDKCNHESQPCPCCTCHSPVHLPMMTQPLLYPPPRRRPLMPMAHKPHLYPLATGTVHASLQHCAGGESTRHIAPIPSLTRSLCSGSLAAHLPRTLSMPPAMAPALEAPIGALRLRSTSTLPATSPLMSQVI
jgi:hypothetical protein